MKKKKKSGRKSKSSESVKTNKRTSKHTKASSVVEVPEETSFSLKEKYDQSLKNKKQVSFIDEPILRQLGYDIRQVITAGKYSTHKRILAMDEEYVVRIIEKSHVSDMYLQLYRNELKMIRELNHRSIIVYTQGIETMYKIYVISKLEANGSLKNLLEKMRYIPEDMCKNFFTDILIGLNYCHTKNVAHSNINSKTLFVNSSFVLKISNFKLAQKFRTSERCESRKYYGNYHYTAPEVLMCEPYNPFLADVWSIGVVFHEMLTGKVPFHGLKDEDILYNLPEIASISPESAETLAYIFKPSYERVSLDELMKFPWVEGKIVSNAETKELRGTRVKRLVDSASKIMRR